MASQAKINESRAEVDLLSNLLNILEANERSIEEKMALCLRMESIDHTSNEKDYQAKLQWLLAQGKGGEIKAMIEDREQIE